jgi:coenzyme F420-reducing hydrogenase delta subunit/quinol-cytochrome oxidoreductase complex cytochrome b subunit/Pyruvate/2-oxoacid:ferredoxin oxidoreductase delta subunit
MPEAQDTVPRTGGADARAREPLRSLARALFDRVDTYFDAAFGARANPWRLLGALAWYLFWIVAATGIYVYAAFDTSAAGAYSSVERITANAWPLSGLARSLHRYASDAFILLTVLHLAREWAHRRYAHVQRFAWLTGVALLLFVWLSGIGGYWLVWDRLAQFSIIATTEWLDALPLFSEPLAANFDADARIGDRFFSLLIFLHIGIPLGTLALMWVHVQRLQRPATQPPRMLAWGTLAALVLLSIARPVTSDAPASLAEVPTNLALDWFYLAPHVIQYAWSPLALWSIVGVATTALVLLPYVSRAAREPRRAAAVVQLANCNGCRRCFADCPYNAVEMVSRTDGRPHPFQASVRADLCAGCGICAGACPSSTPFRSVAELVTGIDLPQKPVGAARATLERELARIVASRRAAATSSPRILVVGCDESIDVVALRSPDTAAMTLLCAAQLPPSFVEYALRSGADGVLVTGCREGDCVWRLGQEWTADRFAGERAPKLRAAVARERVRIAWAGRQDAQRLATALEAFRADLGSLPADARATLVPPKREQRLDASA